MSVIIIFMKKFLFAALALVIALFSFAVPPNRINVHAQTGGYACVLTDNAYFYADREQSRGLFVFPKTYYVKIVETQTDYCKVEYLYDDAYVQKLTGYMKTEDLTFVDYVPKRPYLYRLMEIRYTLANTPDDDGFLTELTATCAYYGDYPVGTQTYCYVLRGSQFGYVPKPTGFTYDVNTEYEETFTPQPEPSQPQPQGENNAAQIAILIVLCLLVPALAALILKPPRRPPYEQE